MLGFLGWVVQQYVHLPGEIYAESNPLKALASVPLLSQIQIFLFIGAIELATLDQTYTADKPWDLGFDPLNFSKVCERVNAYATVKECVCVNEREIERESVCERVCV
eukprot:evm.model.NODE_23502_length_7635_cov_33.958744.2